MIAIVFATLLAATDSASPSPRTLAGVYLGESLSSSDLKGLSAQRLPDSIGPIEPGTAAKWMWKRQSGGVVTVSPDNQNYVLKIDFQVTKGEQDSVDLPCDRSFSIQGSHVNLGFGAETSGCTLVNGTISTYKVPGGSTFEARFDDSMGDGGLLEAIWTQKAS